MPLKSCLWKIDFKKQQEELHMRLQRLETLVKIQEVEAKKKDRENEKLEKIVESQKKKLFSKNKEKNENWCIFPGASGEEEKDGRGEGNWLCEEKD